jgi:DNA polymerase-3 subunit gamma/tau
MSDVLALKYRPKNFNDLVGQDTISDTLSLALDHNRLSHAYLFSGLRGSGKTSTARIFSKALLCDHGPTSKPCEVCEQCTMANENRHIDIIEMDAASSRKIDDIRDLIEQTKYKPAAARFKIFIIDEVHMLTREAFNALLKTLEEPPSYIKFILATTDPLKLPATILSRTQHFRFKKIATHTIKNHLGHILNLENIDYEVEALDILARSGSGSLRDTLTLLDQAIIYSKNYVDVKTVSDMLGLVDPLFIETIFEAIFNKDHEKVIELIQALESYEAPTVVDELIAYLKTRLYAHDRRYSMLIMDRFFRILSESKSLFAINADGSFVLSLVFLKMIEAMQVKSIDDMIEQLQSDLPIATQSIASTPTPQTTEVVNTPPAPIQTIPERPKIDEALQKFNTLQEKLQDRNADLGNCFKKYVTYVSFEHSVLTWRSCADEACKKSLRYGWGIIKHFVQELFGIETKIENLPCDKEPEEENIPHTHPQETTQPSFQNMKPPVPELNEVPIQHNESLLEEQAQQHIEEEQSVVDHGSCVSPECEQTTQLPTLDAQEMIKDPFVQRAKELFQATGMKVQTKV